MRFALSVFFACAILWCGLPANAGSAEPRLEIAFLQWMPGPPPLDPTISCLDSKDFEILTTYRVGGSITSANLVSVTSPTGLDARMVVFIRRPITSAQGTVCLPILDSGTDYWKQEPVGFDGWSGFPARTVYRHEHYIILRRAGAHGELVEFEVTGAAGEISQGVAARWPVTPGQTTTQSN